MNGLAYLGVLMLVLLSACSAPLPVPEQAVATKSVPGKAAKVPAKKIQEKAMHDLTVRYQRLQGFMHCKIYDLSKVRAERIYTWYTVDDQLEDFGVTCYDVRGKEQLELYFVSDFKDWKLKWFFAYSADQSTGNMSIGIASPCEFYELKSWRPVVNPHFKGPLVTGSTINTSKGQMIAKSGDGKIKVWVMAVTKEEIELDG